MPQPLTTNESVVALFIAGFVALVFWGIRSLIKSYFDGVAKNLDDHETRLRGHGQELRETKQADQREHGDHEARLRILEAGIEQSRETDRQILTRLGSI